MSVTRIPRAPMVHSSSITRWAPARGTIARTATQPSRCSGETVGLSMPGVSATARPTCSCGDVVVHHHVAAGHHHALEPAAEDVEPGRRLAAPGDQHGLGLQDRVAERLEARLGQGAAGLDHVGDHVGDAELHAGLDGPVEPVHGGVDPALGEELPHDADVGRGDPRALELGEVGVAPHRTGEAEGAAPEAEPEHLLGLGAGVEQEVAAGDADVEGALADVERDVARAQVEELDAVVDVDQRQLLGVLALPVAGLAQHLDGGLRQRALVGDGDPQRRSVIGGPHRWV